jgi:rieske iron-sulfur protein
LPMLDLEVDDKGDIWIKPPNWNPSANGVVGYGRYIT